jgi:hypothetical protein
LITFTVYLEVRNMRVAFISALVTTLVKTPVYRIYEGLAEKFFRWVDDLENGPTLILVPVPREPDEKVRKEIEELLSNFC